MKPRTAAIMLRYLILGLSLLMVALVVPGCPRREAPEVPEVTEVPETPEVPEAPEVVPTPEAPEDIEEVEYFALFMEGKKVGHAIGTREEADGKVTTSEEVSISISRMGTSVTMNMKETSVETADGKPVSFESVQDIGLMVMRVAGTISEDGVMEITAGAKGMEEKSTKPWPEGAVMAEGLRLFELEKGMKKGTTYMVKLFSPGMMGAVDVEVVVGEKQKVDLLGRVVSLTEVTNTMIMPGAGRIATTGYVDDEFQLKKTVMPIAGMHIEMVACTKAFALSENDVLDVIDKMFLVSPVSIGNARSAESITYHLAAKEPGKELNIPVTDNQTVSRKGGKVIVTVKPAAAGKAKFPYKGDDPNVLGTLEPTRYVQSDRPEIKDLARKAVGRTKDAAEAARKIEAFVANYVDNKSLSVGYASAVEVADSRQGDCSEFAVLTAAMCKSVGIPAQVVVGIAYVKEFAGLEDRFGGHAWVQAYVGDKWVGLDAAFKSGGRGGYGPGHIALAVGDGNPEDFFNLVGTLGQFEIERIEISK